VERIRRPKIGELAHQAKGERIFAAGEYPAKNTKASAFVFFICAAGTTSFAWHTQHHLTVRSTSLPLAAQMNDVEALPQMKWACAQ